MICYIWYICDISLLYFVGKLMISVANKAKINLLQAYPNSTVEENSKTQNVGGKFRSHCPRKLK